MFNSLILPITNFVPDTNEKITFYMYRLPNHSQLVIITAPVKGSLLPVLQIIQTLLTNHYYYCLS